MSIRVEWHNEYEQLLIVEFTARWTWTAFFKAKSELDAMLDEMSSPTNCLFLLPSDILLPPDSIRNGQQAFDNRHTNLNHIIVVKPNLLIRTIYDMVLKKSPTVIDFVSLADTSEHALQMLDTSTLN